MVDEVIAVLMTHRHTDKAVANASTVSPPTWRGFTTTGIGNRAFNEDPVWLKTPVAMCSAQFRPDPFHHHFHYREDHTVVGAVHPVSDMSYPVVD